MSEQADGVGARLVALARRAPGLTAMLLATAGAWAAGLAIAGGAAWLIISRGATSLGAKSPRTPTATPTPIPGTRRWGFLAGGPVASSPVVVNGVMYIGSTDHYLYAVNA